jgi:hypothetical protein
MYWFIRGLLIAGLCCPALEARAQPWSQLSTNPPMVAAGAGIPAFPRVAAFSPDPGMPSLTSERLVLIHSTNVQSGFIVQVDGQTIAVGSMPTLIGYVAGGQLRWLDSSAESVQRGQVARQGEVISASCETKDKNGATWSFRRWFRPSQIPGAIEVETEVGVDQDRAIAFLPMFLLFPGVGSFGADKNQGLFAGLEYLENEPSSSEADVIGAASKRQVPDTEKITMPLMAIQAEGHYVALTWQMRPSISAVFDSPDRLFRSGGHVLGLLFPGSNGKNRQEGNVLPRVTEPVRAGSTIRNRAVIFGGAANSVVPAVQQYCRLRRLAPVPPAPDLASYVSLASGGWLHSKIREGNLIRHALASSGFNPQPAADAALWMEWLADKSSQPDEAAQLLQLSTNVLSAVSPGDYNVAGVGHVRYPVESLVFGHVAESVERAKQAARALLSGFESDGSMRYRAKPGETDFSKTHFTNEASGFTARAVADLLQNAAFCGDRDLIKVGLQRLRDMQVFDNGVPRGAQTWECPLHTPDILAAAHLVRAYTLGYELSGDDAFLEEARYWAWTGLPFVYLVSPTDKPIGLYSTIAVYGATQWRAPVWFGLPVQWCGLVYADALYRLAHHDQKGIWKEVADGITISGIEQTWPSDEAQYQGLLPDSFVLRDQKRNGPAINPATVQACASRLFGPGPVYDLQVFRKSGLLVHAPGVIEKSEDESRHLTFEVSPWVKHPCFILINGFTETPHLKINGQAEPLAAPHSFAKDSGRLVIQLMGHASLDISW